MRLRRVALGWLGAAVIAAPARAQTFYFGRPFAGVELEPAALAQDAGEGIDETRPRRSAWKRAAELQLEGGFDPDERSWNGSLQLTASVGRRWALQAGLRADLAQVEGGADSGLTETLVVAPPWRAGGVSFAAIPFASQGRRSQVGALLAAARQSPYQARWRHDLRAAVGAEREGVLRAVGLLAFIYGGIGRNLSNARSVSLAASVSTERIRGGPVMTTARLEPLWREGELKLALAFESPTDQLRPQIGAWIARSF